MISTILAVYCIGVVGNIQVVEIKGKSHFIKDHTIPCVWKSNVNKSTKNVVEEKEEENAFYMFSSIEELMTSNIPDANAYLTAMMPPTSQDNSFCPSGKYGWVWDISEMDVTVIGTLKVKRWGHCTERCAYKRLDSGALSNCENGDN